MIQPFAVWFSNLCVSAFCGTPLRIVYDLIQRYITIKCEQATMDLILSKVPSVLNLY